MSTLESGVSADLICATLAAAEEIRDPLEDLVERTKANPGVAFEPETLERLAALKRDNQSAFESLRRELQKAGCRVTALDEAIAEKRGGAIGRRPTQANILIELAQPADLFDAPDGTAFADIVVNGHRETWPIRSKGFRRWLNGLFYEATGGAPNSEAVQSALNVIESTAHYGGQKHVVHVRIGEADDRLYLDLCDDAWRAVEIDAQGWVVDTTASSEQDALFGRVML